MEISNSNRLANANVRVEDCNRKGLEQGHGAASAESIAIIVYLEGQVERMGHDCGDDTM